MHALPFSSRSRRLVAGIVAVAVLLQSGCATVAPAPTAHQGDPGWVAVVAGTQAPKLDFQGFARSKGEGAIRGAGAGLGECFAAMSHGGCSGDFCGAVLILMLGICGVVGVVGGIAGASEAPSAQEARADEGRAQAALAMADIQQTLRNHVVAAAMSGGERLIEPPPASGADGTAGYEALAAAGVDTVLEVTLLGAGTEGGGINAPVGAYMTARARLVSTSDGRERFARDYTFLGPRRTLAEWAADDARRLRQMLEVGYLALGEHIYDSVFRLYPFPDRGPRGAGLLSAAFGLAPLEPRTRGQLTGDGLVGASFEWTKVADRQPTLLWDAFPRPGDVVAAPAEMARVANVRYDLVVAREENLAPAEVVYRRDGLPGASHRLAVPLASGTRYFWTVRARFDLDGRERVTEWGSVHFVARDQVTSPSSFSYRFRTP